MVVLVSSMTDIKHLQSIINDLDGYIVLEWSKDVTHLTTVKAKLREKVKIINDCKKKDIIKINIYQVIIIY